MWWAVLLSWWLLGSLASCCPQHCRCFTDDDGYKVANCSKSGLLSGDIAPTIDILNFKNQLRGSRTKLEARIFKNFRGVHYLNLQNSSISHLPNDVFDGLSRVVRIDLSFNKIKHLNGVVFKSLPSLRYLNLRGNFLSISPLEVIVSNTLQELDMGLCSITSIPLHLFGSAPNIRSLKLDGNFIQTLEYNVLPKGLTYLNLANNNIIKPPINVFNSLRHLIRLDISNNPINCSCSLLVFQDTLSGRAGILENDVVCSNPPHLLGRKISAVNENQLCRDDYMKREGINSFMHLRKKKRHHIDPQVQSDEPLMMDESYGAREAAEVMFTNDETNQMGTHMENRLLPQYHSEETSHDKLETMDETTTNSIIDNGSPEVDDRPLDLTHLDNSPTTVSVIDPIGAYSADAETNDGTTTESEPSIAAEEETKHSSETESTAEPSPPDHSMDRDDESTDGLFIEDGNMTTTANEVEILPGIVSDHDELSHLEAGTTESNLDKRFTLPTFGTEPSDYSYDSQHGDYGIVDNSTSSDTDNSSTPSSSEPEFNEGSGDSPDYVTEANESSSTIGFIEDREAETEESSLKTVSDNLDEFSSTTTSYDLTDQVTTEVVPSSSEQTSVTAEELEETSSDPSVTETPTESTVEISSAMSSTDMDEVFATSEYSTSVDPTSEVYITEPTSEASSSEHSDIYDDLTETPTTESSTEMSSNLPTLPVETSSEASSSVFPSVGYTSQVSAVTEVSTSTSLDYYSREQSWWDSDEVEVSSPSSSTASNIDEMSSTSLYISHKKPKMIEPTTESSVSPDVEVLKVVVDSSNKENIREDPSRIEEEKNILSTGITFIIIGLLIALVLILLTIIVCKKKKTSKKIRLPADPETATGTELQDMLLPKPPENGIKVLPKNYTNGTTPISNGKTKEPEINAEEVVPVLTQEPETDEQEPEIAWEDKPEPIEVVTARLTMLARPQTPIFIQKSLN